MEAAARPNPATKPSPEAMPQGVVNYLSDGLTTLLQSLRMALLGGGMA